MKKLLIMTAIMLFWACEKETQVEITTPEEETISDCIEPIWEDGYMPVINGVIVPPVDFGNSVGAALGLGSPWDCGYLCSNAHGRINAGSYIKPVINTEKGVIPSWTDAIYAGSTKLRTYKIGDPLPTDYKLIYYPPTGGASAPYRIADFDGYNHEEYPARLDLSAIPTAWDSDNYTQSFPITRNSSRALIQILMNAGTGTTLWNTAILIVAKKGTSTRYFITTTQPVTSWRVVASAIASDTTAWNALRSMDIGTWNCTVMGILIPYNHSDQGTLFREISASSGYIYPLIPETLGSKPYKENVVISTPANKSFWSVELYEGGDGNQYAIPGNLSMQGYVMAKTSNTVLWTNGAFTWNDVRQQSGNINGGTMANGNFAIVTGYTALQAEINISDHYVSATGRWYRVEVYGHNADSMVYDSGLRMTTLKWNLTSIGGPTRMTVTFSVPNPDYRED